MSIQPLKKTSKRQDHIMGVCALVIILAAWIMGSFRAEADLEPFLKEALPEASFIEPAGSGTYAAWEDQNRERLLGYITTDSAHGYGGKMRLAVAVSLEGTVIGLAIIEHRETVSFLRRALRSDLLNSLKGKKYSDPISLDKDIDGVTGATYSSRSFIDAVRKASRKVASKNLGFAVAPEPSPRILFGLPEISLIALFAFGIAVRTRRFKHKKPARWISMLLGLALLGFAFNKPLTIVLINKMLLGFWPAWQIHLYWYLLLVGILFVYTADNKNPYCEWFCPFGSAQECLGVIGGAKVHIPESAHSLLRWFQRLLALGAIVLALLYRNPGLSSYEVFGAFFRLIGTNFHFILLGIVLLASLFIRRPWCSYLCPLRPVTDFIRLMRNWVKDFLVKLKPNLKF